MFSFLISIVALILGYVLYGRYVARVVYADPNRATPATLHADGVDFIQMPTWKVFMIQFLNIAGTGPIFGAIMGAKFGPSCFLWIVFGCIFAGAVHDYVSGIIMVRKDGFSYNEMIGYIFGKKARAVVTVLVTLLLLLVGAVFVYSPAIILSDLVSSTSMMFWVIIIFIYYLIASLLPIDKIIGKIYPVFAICILFMAVGLFGALLVHWPGIPEFWHGLANRSASVGVVGQDLFPCLFVTVACGAISGFHATQSPLMARCISNEKYARPVFYGSMITEGIVALIWAAVSSWFFFDGGIAETAAPDGQAPTVVVFVAKHWLGVVGGILAIIGVVAAPITTGDTALRSARLIVGDFLHLNQRPVKNRLLISIPIFAATILLLWYNMADAQGFNNIWRYFGWINQTLACFTLWALTQWLYTHTKTPHYLITMIPALFMSAVCVSFILVDKTGVGLPFTVTPWVSAAAVLLGAVLFKVLNRNTEQFQKL
ncbi:MAG: carbon starvation protein A [Bacteroidales bacterium]|nr:carbon starvation protein A [Bacteroidales bacterium]